jgi:hypothetical protein
LRERVAWWWTDLAAGRPAQFAWLASASLFVVLEGAGALVARSFGELRAFAADPRWTTSALIISLSAYQLMALPRAIDQFWEKLSPWLSNSDEEIASLKSQTRPLLARFFPASALVWLAFGLAWVLTGSWGEFFQSRQLAPILNALYGFGFRWYFLGIAAVFNSVGLWMLLRLLGRTLQFRPSLLLSGGKGALRPFNRLLWTAWRYFMAMIILAGISTMPVRGKGWQIEDAILWIVIAMVLALQLSSQRPINKLLAADKTVALRTFREHLDRDRVAVDHEPLESLRRLNRVQILLHDLHTVESFAPTLVDGRFVVNIALSVAASLITNILLQTVIATLLRR